MKDEKWNCPASPRLRGAAEKPKEARAQARSCLQSESTDDFEEIMGCMRWGSE